MSPRGQLPLAAAVAAAALLLLLGAAEGRVFDRCGLVRELRRQKFPSDKMRDWVCLVEAESSRSTSKRSPRNKDGSYDYGLFQINSRYWCGIGKVAGDCHVKCEDLQTDNITVASRCAKKIYGIHGFKAWYGWQNKCRGKPLPDISRC